MLDLTILAYSVADEMKSMESVGGVPSDYNSVWTFFCVLLPLLVIACSLIGAVKCPFSLIALVPLDMIYFGILWGDGNWGTCASGIVACLVLIALGVVCLMVLWVVESLFA